MKNNHQLRDLRLSEELNKDLNEASNELGLNKSALVRFLLNRAMKELKRDSIKAGGYDKLEIEIRS